MEKYLVKVKHIVPAFLYMLAGTVGLAMLVRWLTMSYEVFEIKEDIWNIIIPIGLPWIPITIWLRPRLRILVRKRDSDRLQLLYQMIGAFTITASMIVSQHYLTSEVGALVSVRTVEELGDHTTARYYHIEKFFVQPDHIRMNNDIRASGKHNQYLDINFYFMIPVTNDSVRNDYAVYDYWYAIKLHKQISNRLSPEQKQVEFEYFQRESATKIINWPYYDVQYFRRLPNSSDRELFYNALPTNLLTDKTIVLEARQDDFAARSGNKLFWIFGSAGIGLFVFLFALIWPRYSVMELQRQQQGRKPAEDDVVEMFKFLIPKEPHLATSIILDINIVVFLFMVFSGVHFMSPNVPELMAWGANRRYETMHDEWWRLVTSMFVHGGVVHLIYNIFGLVMSGIYLESVLGWKKYALIYLLSGIAGSIASIVWYTHTASVGASGAIFGLFGAILSLTINKNLPKELRKVLLYIFGPYVAIGLLFGLAGGIDNAAHIGGLVCGFITALIIQWTSKDEETDTENLL